MSSVSSLIQFKAAILTGVVGFNKHISADYHHKRHVEDVDNIKYTPEKTVIIRCKATIKIAIQNMSQNNKYNGKAFYSIYIF